MATRYIYHFRFFDKDEVVKFSAFCLKQKIKYNSLYNTVIVDGKNDINLLLLRFDDKFMSPRSIKWSDGDSLDIETIYTQKLPL